MAAAPSVAFAGGKTAVAGINARRADAKAAGAEEDVNYVSTKEVIVKKIKERGEELHEKLRQLQEEATRFVEELVKRERSQNNLTSMREDAEKEILFFQKKHVENLIRWASELIPKAEARKRDMEEIAAQKQTSLDQARVAYRNGRWLGSKKELDAKEAAKADLQAAQDNIIKSQQQIEVAQEYKNRAESILKALESYNDWLERKDKDLDKLKEKRATHTSFEGTRFSTEKEYKEAKEAYKADWSMNELLYSQKKEAKKAAKKARDEAVTKAAQASKFLKQAEEDDRITTQDLAAIDARLNIWNSLTAWSTVAIADHDEEKSEHHDAVASELDDEPLRASFNSMEADPVVPRADEMPNILPQGEEKNGTRDKFFVKKGALEILNQNAERASNLAIEATREYNIAAASNLSQPERLVLLEKNIESLNKRIEEWSAIVAAYEEVPEGMIPEEQKEEWRTAFNKAKQEKEKFEGQRREKFEIFFHNELMTYASVIAPVSLEQFDEIKLPLRADGIKRKLRRAIIRINNPNEPSFFQVQMVINLNTFTIESGSKTIFLADQLEIQLREGVEENLFFETLKCNLQNVYREITLRYEGVSVIAPRYTVTISPCSFALFDLLKEQIEECGKQGPNQKVKSSEIIWFGKN
ncbi:MAG: hypothetical protein K2W97_02100 [Chthoniobacterales bacterium]|nr:hypothetical protein [Chthoniobacterales bacterium]